MAVKLEGPLSCRSDLSDADIEGADFSNALLDKPMQTVRNSPSPRSMQGYFNRPRNVEVVWIAL